MPAIHPRLRALEWRWLNKELERQGRKESEAGKWTDYTQMPGPTHPDTYGLSLTFIAVSLMPQSSLVER